MKKNRNPSGSTGLPVSLNPLTVNDAVAGLLQVKPKPNGKANLKTKKKARKAK